MGWSRYRDKNPVPTSPLVDDLATAPSGPVPNKATVLYVDQSEVSTLILVATNTVHCFSLAERATRSNNMSPKPGQDRTEPFPPIIDHSH